MKKFIFIAALLFVGDVKADVVSSTSTIDKVVEIRIYKKEISAANQTKRKKVKKLLNHGTCSGAFINAMGDILTAKHCVDRDSDLEVVTSDFKVYKAKVVSTSPIHDLAVIHIDKIETPAFAFAGPLVQGQKVFIRGNPMSNNNVLTMGIVAKLDGDLVLLDCAALPGNSGGPVYDEQGRLAGIVTNIYTVGLGVTHLSVAQGQEAILFFLLRVFNGR